jgi:hypothetical protein
MAYFRIVTMDGIITCEELCDMYRLGSIDERAYIEFEDDGCIIRENRKKDDYIITMKEEDVEVNQSFINDVCKAITRIRCYLDELFKFRLNAHTYVKDSNRNLDVSFKNRKK